MKISRTKTLQKQFQLLIKSISNHTIQGIKIITDQKPHFAVFSIQGPSSSPYKGFSFQILFEWTSDYPFIPPRIFFKDKIWSPYINFQTGHICENVNEGLLSVKTTQTHLKQIIQLLSKGKIQQNYKIINHEAAKQMQQSQELFYLKVRQKCRQYNINKNEGYTDQQEQFDRKFNVESQSEISKQKQQNKSQNDKKYKTQTKYNLYLSEDNQIFSQDEQQQDKSSIS